MVEGKNEARGQWIGRTSQNKMMNFTASGRCGSGRSAAMFRCVTTREFSQQPGGRNGDIRSELKRCAFGELTMEVEMKIRGLMMDPVTNMPIVILKDAGSDTVLPIWVGDLRGQCHRPGNRESHDPASHDP